MMPEMDGLETRAAPEACAAAWAPAKATPREFIA